jgi:DNA-binding SARP family transcriptional activator
MPVASAAVFPHVRSGRQRPASLSAHYLGAFRVAVDGVLVDTNSSRRTRNLIAYLIARRHAAVPRDVLMEVFWPTATPESARNSLHVALSSVRRTLRAASPEPLIERCFESYRIAPSVRVWTDFERFEQEIAAGDRAEKAGEPNRAVRSYETACQMYEGDFLADEPYLEWASARREELRLLAVDVQSRLIDVYARQGRYGPAVLLGRRVLTIDPCNEPVHRRLMECYAASDQRHLALFHYHQMSATLWDMLQIRPSTETAALFEQLRQING